MELAISLWQESGLSKYAFCKKENLDRTTFNYWLSKFGHKLGKRKGSRSKSDKPKRSPSSFVPVEVSSQTEESKLTLTTTLEIEYPNGVKLSLPIGITTDKLRELISLC